MFARVTRFVVPPEGLQAEIDASAGIGREVEEAPGGVGLFYLVDRGSGKAMAITLWESEKAMRESEQLASRVTERRAAAASATMTDQERYEVVTEPARLPASAPHR